MNHTRKLRHQRNEQEFRSGLISQYMYEMVKRDIDAGIFDETQPQPPRSVLEQARKSLHFLRWPGSGVAYFFRDQVQRRRNKANSGLFPSELPGLTPRRLYELALRRIRG